LGSENHSEVLRMSTAGKTVEQDFDILEAVGILRKSWPLIVSTAAVFGLVAGIAAVALPKKYEASTILSPVTEDPSSGKLGGISSALGSLGGLASLAGISTQANSTRADTLATLQSRVLTEEYIQENGLIGVLLGSASPGGGAGSWFPIHRRRTLWAANVFFDKNVRKVTDNARTGLVTLSIRWKDPVLASKWANDLVQLTNRYLRDKAVVESERNIAYLSDQLAKTNVVELRTAIYSLMESEIKKEMLARGSDEYALKVIDPAAPPEKPVFPLPGLWVTAAIVVGLLLSCLYVLAKSRVRQA
jgi:uncharacterized protein involved in exopolysaccharide biosynthesis